MNFKELKEALTKIGFAVEDTGCGHYHIMDCYNSFTGVSYREPTTEGTKGEVVIQNTCNPNVRTSFLLNELSATLHNHGALTLSVIDDAGPTALIQFYGRTKS